MGKLKIEALSLIFALFCYFSCLGQFSKAINGNSSSGVVFINNNDEILHGNNEVITKFDISGNILWSKELLPYSDNGISHKASMRHTSRFLNNGDFLFTNVLRPFAINKASFSKLNSSGLVEFTKLIKYPLNYLTVYQTGKQKIPKSIEFDSGNYILLNHLSDPEETNYYYSFVKFNNQGEIVWHKEFKDLLPGTPITIVNKLNNNRVALIRNGRFDLNNEEQHVENTIQILDDNFSELKTIQIDGMIEKIIFKNNHYYILVFWYGFRNSQTDLTNSLICLNQDFEPIWAKEYIPSSRIIHLTFSKNDSGFLMSESVGLNSKMNLIAIDDNGNALNSRILATPSSSRVPSVSNNFFIHEGGDFQEPTQPQQLTCSSNTLESLPCYSPNDCIEVINFDAKINIIEDFFLEPISLDIEVTDAVIETVDYKPNYYDFCNENFLGFPAPLFSIPDTICTNEPISASNLQNENAESVNWLLPESSIRFSNLSTPPDFSYPTAGTYTITQQVTFEGCTNEYSRDIIVIAPIDLAVETDIILCDTDPYLIDASNDLALAHLWQDSTIDPTLLIDDQGIYSVAITDKYCTQTIDFNANYFDYNTIDPLLSEDSLICLQQPLTIGQYLDPTVQLSWSDEHTSYPRRVSSPGVYTLTTSLGECSTQSSVFIDVENCATRIFMPNIFSPNKDGINDLLYPLGDNFQLIQYSIYNRWGNIVHDSLSPWDGTFRNETSSNGVYTYTLKLQNLRLNTVENKSGTFTLIR